MADTEGARVQCKQDIYNPSSGFLWLMLLNLLAIGPVLFFLYKLERILNKRVLLK